MSDAYDYGVANTGPLKLKKSKGLFKKTSSAKGKDKRKHKHKRKSKTNEQDASSEDDNDKDKGEKKSDKPSESMTEAEKKYREILKQRKLERIERLASKSYRERVKEFNEKLERTPEHHDMPKVGPG
ncbi:hypothetical protein FB645_003446 [Coemansia sp. IMI 203386]|nr:hypothetical protein FB645_003446 [Coemansia sp. IMI 203386]